MFDRMHEMRTRIITSPSFNGDRVLGAILFESTMDREIEGRGTADYLWNVKSVVPVPEGRQGPRRRGRRRPGDEADARPRRRCSRGPSTRACSARRCARSSSWPTTPASTPSSTSSSRSAARSSAPAWCRSSSPRSTSTARRRPRPRSCSRRRSSRQLDALGADQQVMLKLTLPEDDDFYADLVEHPQRAAGRRALGRLQPRRGQRAPGPQPRRDRQLLAGAHRGPDAPSRATTSSTPRSTRATRTEPVR